MGNRQISQAIAPALEERGSHDGWVGDSSEQIDLFRPFTYIFFSLVFTVII